MLIGGSGAYANPWHSALSPLSENASPHWQRLASNNVATFHPVFIRIRSDSEFISSKVLSVQYHATKTTSHTTMNSIYQLMGSNPLACQVVDYISATASNQRVNVPYTLIYNSNEINWKPNIAPQLLVNKVRDKFDELILSDQSIYTKLSDLARRSAGNRLQFKINGWEFDFSSQFI